MKEKHRCSFLKIVVTARVLSTEVGPTAYMLGSCLTKLVHMFEVGREGLGNCPGDWRVLALEL